MKLCSLGERLILMGGYILICRTLCSTVFKDRSPGDRCRTGSSSSSEAKPVRPEQRLLDVVHGSRNEKKRCEKRSPVQANFGHRRTRFCPRTLGYVTEGSVRASSTRRPYTDGHYCIRWHSELKDSQLRIGSGWESASDDGIQM